MSLFPWGEGAARLWGTLGWGLVAAGSLGVAAVAGRRPKAPPPKRWVPIAGGLPRPWKLSVSPYTPPPGWRKARLSRGVRGRAGQ